MPRRRMELDTVRSRDTSTGAARALNLRRGWKTTHGGDAGGFIKVGFRVRLGNQAPRIRFGEGSFSARARQGGRGRRADVWGQCGKERRDGACSPARERKGGRGISAVGPTPGPRWGGRETGRGGAGWAACCGSAGFFFLFFFSILFFQSLFPKRILNAKTNKI